jgi:cytoskeletal protein CcmA (bactofilin family)
MVEKPFLFKNLYIYEYKLVKFSKNHEVPRQNILIANTKFRSNYLKSSIMFGSSTTSKPGEIPSFNHIQSDTFIEGDIKAEGNLRIDGRLKGTLNIKGKLVVGTSGKIEGEVHCANADISGTIDGKVNVSELLSLKSTAKLSGEIISGKLAIEPGADFSGSCKMGGVIKDIKNGNRTEGSKSAEKTA